MRNWDEYQELYNTQDDWYLKYVDSELKRIKKRYRYENNRRTEKRNR